ncbi:MAG: SIR2 family protein, partial [Haliea sp.]
MKNIKLTPWLLKAIQNGEAIMFLGAGSTIGARRQDGKSPSNASQLRDLLSDTFLGGKRKEWPLDRVADYAKNISNLGAVQSFIREQFEDLKPAPFHYLIPKFRWFAIVTTNYDLVLERTYEKAAHKLQNLAPIIRDGDNFSQKLIDPNLVPYLKLHGCISVVNDPSLPLILASEEYAK